MPNKDVKELPFMKDFTEKYLDKMLDALKSQPHDSSPHQSNQSSDSQYNYRRDSYSPHDSYSPSKSPYSPDPYLSSYRSTSPIPGSSDFLDCQQ